MLHAFFKRNPLTLLARYVSPMDKETAMTTIHQTLRQPHESVSGIMSSCGDVT
ncbi:hypothetical protein KP509_04G027700 [Ceratopteris richardii]|uniref:Uncharacterized protein n=1 Tax=Ceratopteris richardii TaxID=49495 RepID=A0A8T2UYR7_CERRI|nr:hypothetical protein KP509_04G027700 [Ceratopteris richardii]